MDASFAPLLDGCRPLCPPELVGGGGWERLLDLAGRLPFAVSDTPFGFEFHLGKPSPESDFCFASTAGSGVARHFIREGTHAGRGAPPAAPADADAPADAAAQASTAAQVAAALAAGMQEQAANPDSYLARAVGGMTLEYDLVGLAPGRPPPPPGIFLAPRRIRAAGSSSRRDASGPRDGSSRHRNPASLLPALAATVGWNGHEGILGTVERIFAALPEYGPERSSEHGPEHGSERGSKHGPERGSENGSERGPEHASEPGPGHAHVFQVGAFPARSPKSFRILVGGVPKERVPALLEHLEWPGPEDAAAGVLASMGDLVDSVALSLDALAQGLGPRLGLELYRPRRWSAVDRTGWRPFIARLVECGWCLPAKAEGLQRWPGTDSLLGGGRFHRVRKGINHVKVVVERGARTEAKAYVGMEVRPYR